MKTTFRPGVREYLRTLPAEDRRRIGYAIHLFATASVGDVKRLADSDDYRLRVGDWRVRFTLHGDSVLIQSAKRRDKAYKS